MRLLFLNYECPPVGGGAGFATMALAREMVLLGHDVDLLTAQVGSMPMFEVQEGVRIHRLRTYRRGVHDVGMLGAMSFVLAAALALPRLARRERYDAYHYYFGIPTGLLSRVPGLHRRRPYVLSLRGSDVPGYEPNLSRLHRLMWPITRRVWNDAYRVVANSAGLRDIARRTDSPAPIEVIRNGAVPQLRRAPRADRDRMHVLTVSRLIERKGVDTLIRAIALMKDRKVTLSVVGEGPCREVLEHLARSLGVADRTTFHGFLSPAQLHDARHDADVFALASHSESCSMALLESMGSGLPVVATNVGGTPELISHDRNGLLFQPGDADGLADCLRCLLDEPERLDRYGEANRALTEKEFAWRSVAQRYEVLFRNAVQAADR